MRKLLESSWMKFGPAGRGSYDWVTGSPTLPPMEQQLQGYDWSGVAPGDQRRPQLVLYVGLPVLAATLLVLLGVLLHRRRARSKLTLANVIALDLQDAEGGADFLSSLTGRGERHASTSSDASDGVFLMVYLPPPYEETLTRITRAASITSSRDADSIKIEDLEAKLCPEIRSSGRYM